MAARVFLPDKGELEALARRMYRAMEADGCRRVCLGDMGEADFVAVTRRGRFFPGEDDGRLLGYLLLTDFESRTARLHFCLLRAARASALVWARRAFDTAFGSGRLESIYGIFPRSYRHIPPLARRLGGARLGEIPGAAWDNIRNRPVSGVVWRFTPADTRCSRTATRE